jgi:23S rRNA (uracil1939-C5)-methyltransferase
MDPPRSGSTTEFLRAAADLGPKKIVYVSCNPDTLARDLDQITEMGYDVKKAVPVDLFPYTTGVETVCLLVHSRDTRTEKA